MKCYTDNCEGIQATRFDGDEDFCVYVGEPRYDNVDHRRWLQKFYLSRLAMPTVEHSDEDLVVLFNAHPIQVKREGLIVGWMLAKPRNMEDDRILLRFACMGIGKRLFYSTPVDGKAGLFICGSGRGVAYGEDIRQETDYIEYLAIMEANATLRFQGIDGKFWYFRNDFGALHSEELSEDAYKKDLAHVFGVRDSVDSRSR